MTKKIFIAILSILVFSCQKEASTGNGTNPINKELPKLTTASVVNISTTTATSGGTIISNGNDSITAKGLCWATTPTPTLANFNKSDNGSNLAFNVTIEGLLKNKTYYVRAFATNSIGTAYGNEISFTTDSINHVYVTGSSAGRCTYWKDGIPTPFTNTGTFNYSQANSIFVENNDVYVAGFEKNLTTNILEGKIWKNAVASTVTNGSTNSNAIAISIVNKDTFVLGTEISVVNNNTEGKVWKNGVSTTLSTLSNPAEGLFKHALPQALFIQNNDVYVGGYEIFGVNSDLRGLVWKNGAPTRLLGLCFGAGGGCTYDYTQVNDIFIVGNDVYAVGSSPSGVTGVLNYLIWKNGIPSSINISPASIFIYNNDIYIAGRVGNIACLSKNGIVTQLTNGVKQGFATSVYVKDNDVYVAGFERDQATTFSVGEVWKNGIATNLTDGSGIAEINDIFVK